MRFYRQPAPRDLGLDHGLFWSALLLLCVGLVMVYSASIAMADSEHVTGFRSSYFLGRHALYLVIGVVAAAVLFRVPMWVWQKGAPCEKPCSSQGEAERERCRDRHADEHLSDRLARLVPGRLVCGLDRWDRRYLVHLRNEDRKRRRNRENDESREAREAKPESQAIAKRLTAPDAAASCGIRHANRPRRLRSSAGIRSREPSRSGCGPPTVSASGASCGHR